MPGWLEYATYYRIAWRYQGSGPSFLLHSGGSFGIGHYEVKEILKNYAGRLDLWACALRRLRMHLLEG